MTGWNNTRYKVHLHCKTSSITLLHAETHKPTDQMTKRYWVADLPLKIFLPSFFMLICILVIFLKTIVCPQRNSSIKPVLPSLWFMSTLFRSLLSRICNSHLPPNWQHYSAVRLSQVGLDPNKRTCIMPRALHLRSCGPLYCCKYLWKLKQLCKNILKSLPIWKS